MVVELDRKAVVAARAGSVADFTQLLKASDAKMRALTYRLLHDATAMDDVLQSAYLKAYRGFAAFRGEAGFESWLYQIVYRTCLDHIRSAPARKTETLHDHINDPPNSSDIASTAVNRISVDRALRSLPVDQRAAVWLVDGAGYSFEQAAEILDARPGTIASRVSRGRASLRTSLALTPKESYR